MNPPHGRRRVLVAVGAALSTVTLAGCSGGTPAEGSPSDTTSDAGATPTSATPTASDTSTTADPSPAAGDADSTASPTPDTDTSPTDEPTSMGDELDLREANVVDVAVEAVGGGYRFDVTLYHDDDGEDGYANWWQVETLSGERLGRRELLHAHSTAPFTRSTTVSIPDDVTHVVVRGHDQTHGYGGQAMVVNVDTGEGEAVRQSTDPRSFDDFEPSV